MKHIRIIFCTLFCFCHIAGLQAQSEQLKADIQEIIKDSNESMETNAKIIASISDVIYKYLTE